MPVNAIANTAQPPAAAPSTTTSTSNTTLDRQAFLKLLVAQLRYQDPSKPMDASQMISQSAQLSVVDKLDEISKTLSGSTINDQLMLGGSLIGKAVTFNDVDGSVVTETVSSARLVNGSMVLSAGEWDVPIGAVIAIAPAPVASSPTPAPAALSAPDPLPVTPAASPVTADPSPVDDPQPTNPQPTNPQPAQTTQQETHQ